MTASLKRTGITDFKKRRVIHEAGNRCSFCPEDDISILQPHHIVQVSSGGTDDLENLIAVCPTCHAKIHVGTIPRTQIMASKKAQPTVAHRADRPSPSVGAVIINGAVNESLVAGRDIIYKIAGKKRISMAPLADSLATDPNKIRYCKYLIGRYIELKEWDVGKGNMKYAIIYAAIKREFKASLSDIALCRFDELSDYLQRRILQTKVGRIRNAEGRALFESFSDFVDLHE